MRTGLSCIVVLGAALLSPAARAITRDECRALALARNPELAAAASETTAAAGAWEQARAWPNPELSVEAEDFGGDLPGWKGSQTTVTIAQRIEPFGARGARGAAARFGRTVAREQYARARLDLLAEADRGFTALLAAQERRRIGEETVRLADSLLVAVTALAQAGEVSPIDAERARADRALAAIELDAAALACEQARLALALLLGQETASFTPAAGALEIDPALPAPEALTETAAPSPDLRRWAAEVARRAAALAAERRSRLPQLVASGGYRRIESTREETFLASLAFELPVFDRRSGAIREVAASLAQSESAGRAAALRLASERAAARAALAGALARARAVQATVVPGAERVYRALN
jgi:outer membrane protein, heavy metal efflux system